MKLASMIFNGLALLSLCWFSAMSLLWIRAVGSFRPTADNYRHDTYLVGPSPEDMLFAFSVPTVLLVIGFGLQVATYRQRRANAEAEK